MKILVVSDSHGRDENLEQAVMQETPFDMLIHCGDVERAESFIEAFIECPCHIVSGNNDFFSDLPREEIIEVGNDQDFCHSWSLLWCLHGCFRVVDEVRDHGCNIALFGHTHKPFLRI